MTPEEFKQRMQEIAEKNETQWGPDTEAKHGWADALLCEALRELGYGEGVDVFEKMEKWYA